MAGHDVAQTVTPYENEQSPVSSVTNHYWQAVALSTGAPS